MMPSNLCGHCTQILTTNDDLFHSHHRGAAELTSCPCSLCKLICDGLRNFECPVDEVRGVKNVDFMTFSYSLGMDGDIEGAPMTIQFTVSYPNKKKVEGATPASERFFHQKVLVVKSDDRDKIPVGIPSGNTGSEVPWSVATRWLNTCLNTHPQCAHTKQPKWVPNRLLDVGTQDNTSIRLSLMDQKSPRQPYTTLSHCWGKVEFLQLLKGNFASMKEGIKIDDLPKTFQDAVAITRRLGVRYLWIDSLCIIQKSTEDWARESSMMGDVYQNGLCNIAATGAPDGQWGCFMERDPILAQKCEVRVDRPLSKFNLKPGLYDLVPRNLWEGGLSNAPLNKRAWVAQERILAPRVLHFGRNQLFWECNGLDACEMYPLGAPQLLSRSDRTGRSIGAHEFGFNRLHFKNLDPASVRAEVRLVKAPWTISLISTPPSGKLIDPYYVWNKVLIAYARSALTNEGDKLVAISAVAKLIQTMAKDEYLAGMWRRYLEYHLLWYTDQQDTSRQRPEKYVAPSWSWASMKGRIAPYVYIRPDVPTMIQILDARVERISSDMMGQVSGGYLKLRGWLKKFSILKEKRKFRLGLPDFELPQSADAAQFDEYRQLPESEAWFLPVVGIGPWLECEVLGLMLLETGRKDEFRRVGRFKAYSDIARTFRRPTYPLQSDGVKTSGQGYGKDGKSSKVDNAENVGMDNNKKRWFGKCKMTDKENAWTERIIMII